MATKQISEPRKKKASSATSQSDDAAQLLKQLKQDKDKSADDVCVFC